MTSPLLQIENLHLSVSEQNAFIPILRNISLTIADREIVGLVGETGSGKSTLSESILRLPSNARRHKLDGIILFEGENLLLKTAGEMEKLRGSKISMIFQDSLSYLNPMMTVGDQIIEPMLTHLEISREQAFNKAVEILFHLGITEPVSRMGSYPYELSGGMRKRIMIAIAIACRPKLVIADESTSSLDIITESQVLKLLKNLNASILFISHDLHLTSKVVDRLYVLYSGAIVEQGTPKEIFSNPQHPYTQLLLKSSPRLQQDPTIPLHVIQGIPPLPENRPSGCSFHPRCPYAMNICEKIDPANAKSLHTPCWLYESR